MRRIAVAGASLAGLRAAETLRREGFGGELVLVGAERHFPPYDRPPLSKQVLAGKWEPEKGRLRVADDLDLDLLLGVSVVGADFDDRTLTLDGAGEVAFDALVIATGSSPRTIPGTAEIDGVLVLRTVDDCLALRAELVDGGPLVVIGAGFIGSEVAATARGLGVDVTLVEALELPLVRVLGPRMGEVCAALHRDNGVDLRLGEGVDKLEADGSGRVARVHLAGGSSVDARTVVVGIGVVPNTTWLEGSGVVIDNGVVCDDRCRAVGVPDVVAAGDVARWYNPHFGEHMRVEHWTNATEQAEAAAKALLHGDGAEPYAPIPYFWSDQYDVKFQYIGHHGPGDPLEIVEGDVGERRFVAAWGRDGRTVAALCVNRANRTIPARTAILERRAFPPDLSP